MILFWLIGLLVIAQPAWAQPLPDPLRINQLFANQTTSKVVDYVVITTPPLAPTGACRLYADGSSLYMSCNGGAYAAFGVGSGSVTNIATTSPITGGPITVTGTIACATCVTSAAALTSNRLVLGGGGQASSVLGSLGTTTTVLHGNAAGAPTFGAVDLAADVTGVLPFANGGTGLSSASDDQVMISSGSAWVAKTIPDCTDTGGNHLNYTQSSNSFSCGTSGGSSSVVFAQPGLRLTLTTGVPVTTTDVTGAGTLYYTPRSSGSLVYYTGSAWATATISEISLSLTLTSGKNYDVFVACSSSSSCSLSLSSAWTDDTTRADALGTQNGTPVSGSDSTKLHIGTIRASGTNTTEDSGAKRFVSNRYNSVRKSMANAVETTDSWSYNSTTLRQANSNTANQLDYVSTDGSWAVEAYVHADVSSTVGSTIMSGIGVDSTTTNSAQMYGLNTLGSPSLVLISSARYVGVPGIGRHTLVWLEAGHNAGGATTWYGDAGSPRIQSGISGIGMF